MRKIVVTEGQNLIDIALQEYGAMEGVFTLMEDNGLTSINEALRPGSVLLIRGEEARPDVQLYYANRGWRVNTGDFSLPDAVWQWSFQPTTRTVVFRIQSCAGGRLQWQDLREAAWAGGQDNRRTYTRDVSDRLVRVSFGDIDCTTQIVAPRNGIGGQIDLSVFTGLELADFTDNPLKGAVLGPWFLQPSVQLQMRRHDMSDVELLSFLSYVQTWNGGAVAANRIIDLRGHKQPASSTLLAFRDALFAATGIMALLDECRFYVNSGYVEDYYSKECGDEPSYQTSGAQLLPNSSFDGLPLTEWFVETTMGRVTVSGGISVAQFAAFYTTLPNWLGVLGPVATLVKLLAPIPVVAGRRYRLFVGIGTADGPIQIHIEGARFLPASGPTGQTAGQTTLIAFADGEAVADIIAETATFSVRIAVPNGYYRLPGWTGNITHVRMWALTSI